MPKSAYTCCLCGEEQVGYGNNPAPIGKMPDRCCSTCNSTKVIPARIFMMSNREFAAEDSQDEAGAAIVGGIFTVSMSALLEHLGTALENEDASAATFFKDCIDYMAMAMVSSYEDNTKNFPEPVKYAIDMTLGMTAKQLGEWESNPSFEELTNSGSRPISKEDVDTMSEVVLDEATDFKDDFGVMYSSEDREKWGHSLSEVIYDDEGNRMCGCEDDDPVDECCIIDPRHPIYNEDNLRKAINNLSEIGRSVLNEIFEINPDEDFDGDDLDMWLEDNWWWMDDFSREYWQFAPKRQTKIGKRFGDVWDWLDEYGNLSDQKWSKLLGPDDPRVNPPPTCAGCDSEDIEFYHDYYGGFCGGDCFDGYLEENNLENYSRTEKDLDAESYVDFFSQIEELLDSTAKDGNWILDATTNPKDPDSVMVEVEFTPKDPSKFFDIIE